MNCNLNYVDFITLAILINLKIFFDNFDYFVWIIKY